MSKITNNIQSYFTLNNTRIAFLDGNAHQSLEQCYHSLQQQLSIPEYFGHNLDALEEVLADLEWVEEEHIIIVISNKSQLLLEMTDAKTDFLSILETTDNSRIEIVYLGETN